jgi:sugar phosphate isomerase/epimerase
VEFYACMHEDLPAFFPSLTARNGGINAVSAFAQAFGASGAPGAFADQVRNRFRNATIVGMATFLPELLSPWEQVWREAQNAIKFLIDSARHLKLPKSPFTIELVGGSILHGLSHQSTEDGWSLSVARLDPSKAIDLLLKRLLPVARYACEGERIQLALELEPGPLFALNDKSSLKELCSRLADPSTDGALRRSVGVNLDIPHWAFLSNIDLRWLRSDEAKVVRDRILHAHISDHSNGHFCDNTVGVLHPASDFALWTDFLAEIAAQPRSDELPAFSRFISCEMEACKEKRFINVSLGQLRSLIS